VTTLYFFTIIRWTKNHSYSEPSQFREAVKVAFENADYTSFQEAIEGLDKFQNMTEEKFNEMITHKAEGEKRRTANEANRETAQEALTNRDYQAWLAIDHPEEMLTIIDSETKFLKLCDLHDLKEQIRTLTEEAKTIAEELGLPERKGNKKIGMQQGNRTQQNNSNKKNRMMWPNGNQRMGIE